MIDVKNLQPYIVQREVHLWWEADTIPPTAYDHYDKYNDCNEYDDLRV